MYGEPKHWSIGGMAGGGGGMLGAYPIKFEMSPLTILVANNFKLVFHIWTIQAFYTLSSNPSSSFNKVAIPLIFWPNN